MMSVELTMYFGTNKPNGVVEQKEIFKFIDEYIKPDQASFTYLPGFGFWLNQMERVVILKFILPYTNKEWIKRICSKYCELFEQDSVLVTENECQSELYGK